ncbi:MAG: hypothetical protein FRX49_05241 [Trebouxia sp. A1-2]|nr:MAG: hypothetical protein FRX49_05241 [Trebouxia sp. A1-2]
MSTRQQRREANQAGRFYNVKSGVNSFFTDQALLGQIQQAVQLVTPLLVEGHLLANLHVLRCIEAGEAMPKLDQTFYNRCFYAVSFGTGNRAQQFNRALIQMLNAAALKARVDLDNHVATNFFTRSRRWIRLQLEHKLEHKLHFANMEAARVKSWVSLLCRAATEDSSIWDLLPIYTSLREPPQDVATELEHLVATMQSLMGPLPVTDESLRQEPQSYIAWLHLVLSDFQAAQDTPHAPKLFSMTPQASSQAKFITINSASLLRLLKAAGEKKFTAERASWWQRCTDYQSFCTHTQRTHREFHFQVETDGISVSILMFQPASGSASAPPVAPNSKKRKRRQQQQTSSAWVSGLPDSQLLQAPRIVGLDPGRKALFTAVVHSQPAADSLHRGRPCESMYDTLSWSCSRWQEASGIKHRLRKSELWLNRKPALKAALLDTPTAKVWSTDQFMLHIKHRLQHAPEAIAHFGDRRHRQLRWSTYIKRQQAYAAVCKLSAMAAGTLLWLMGMPVSAAAAAKAIPVHQQCL